MGLRHERVNKHRYSSKQLLQKFQKIIQKKSPDFIFLVKLLNEDYEIVEIALQMWTPRKIFS